MARIHPDRWVYIYGLRDPRTQQMRYIGSSVDPRKRLYEHRTDAIYYGASTPRCKWIRHLDNLGLWPKLVILARTKAQFRDEVESQFIGYYDDLLNVRPPCRYYDQKAS